MKQFFVNLFSHWFGSEPSVQQQESVRSEEVTGLVPYESERMKKILSLLIEKSYAQRMVGQLKSDGRYSFQIVNKFGTTHLTEETECAVFISQTAKYEEIYRVVVSLLGNHLAQVAAFCEDHATHRNELEHSSHMMVVQIAISHATSLSGCLGLTLRGNYGLVGRITNPLTIDGNVDVIGGSAGKSLTIKGSVKSLGVGPFWAENPVTGDGAIESRLVIEGDLYGYKASINNPKLTIEIHGNVTTKGAFLYRSCTFKQMVIKGDLLTEESICPGFYSGELWVCGNAPYLESYLCSERYAMSSAAKNGARQLMQCKRDGNYIFVGANRKQLTKSGITSCAEGCNDQMY